MRVKGESEERVWCDGSHRKAQKQFPFSLVLLATTCNSQWLQPMNYYEIGV